MAMTQSEQTNRLQPPKGAQRTEKKTYQKPEVRHEQVFETRALTCGKMQITQSGCHFERKTS
jgi:hypothetical protein